jgi:uncharacterized damage-inducible protein DinB
MDSVRLRISSVATRFIALALESKLGLKVITLTFIGTSVGCKKEHMNNETLLISESLPSLVRTLNITDQLSALIPEHLLEWRPIDPSGAFQFSLAEIVFHLADERLEFARLLAGTETAETEAQYMLRFSFEQPELEKGVKWTLKPYSGKTQMLDYLKASRAEFQVWLDKPASDLLLTTTGTETAFQKALETAEKRGTDTTTMRKRGAATIMRVLTGAVIHETGHRGTLHALLRQHGINLPEN